MKRYFCWLAVLGIIVLPDWASACWPFWGRPIYTTPAYYPPPVYVPQSYPPFYAYPPVVGTVMPVPGMTEFSPYPRTSAPAHIAPQRIPQISAATIPPEVKPTTAPAATDPAKVEAVRPTSGAIPAEMPAAKKTTPAPDLSTIPKQPSINTPAGLPPLVLPQEKERREPKPANSDTTKKSYPSAVPVPAPSDQWAPLAPPVKPPTPAAERPAATPAAPSAAPAPESLIPPSAVPVIPGSSKSEPLPSLSLPPVVPVIPRGEIESRSSPLGSLSSAAPAAKLYPVAASTSAVPSGGYRTVTFFNHTAQELSLSIEGRSVKLPARSYVETRLGPSFTWSYDHHEPTRERVPNDASGLDVVFGK